MSTTRRPNVVRMDAQWDDIREDVKVYSLTWYPVSTKGTGGTLRLFDFPEEIIIGDTADGDSANKLVCSSATFVTANVYPGMIAYNYTDHGYGTVTAVDSETQLSLDSDAFPDGDESFGIFPTEGPTELLQVYSGIVSGVGSGGKVVKIYYPFGMGFVRGVMVDFPIHTTDPAGWVELVLE